MHNKKILLIVIFFLGVALVLSGCKKASERAAEKIIEGSTGGQADVDISTNTVKINTNSGSYQTGENVTLPSGFPSDIYIIDGTLTAAYTTTQSNGFTLSINTTKSLNEAKGLYEQKLKDDGWDISTSMVYQDSVSLIATKSNRTTSIGINKSENEVIVVITTYSDTSSNANFNDVINE